MPGPAAASRTRRAAALGLLAGALALAGCGSEEAGDAGVGTVRSWGAALGAGDTAAAATRFAAPARVDLGGGPVELVTPRAVRFFQESLPCGAAVPAAVRAGPVVVARLGLTETPRGSCGDAVGDEVLAAFVVRGGRIVEGRLLAP